MRDVTGLDRNFWVTVRASRIQQAKSLEQQHRALMSEIAALDRLVGLESNTRPRQIQDGDTIASALVKSERI